MDNKLTWLHLSDLHLTCIESKDNDWTIKSINQDMVIKSLLKAINQFLIKKRQKPDLIFITGDLVHGGKEEEYKVAEEFCLQLLEITGLTKQQLFIVPGNHDINREEIPPLHITRLYPFSNQDEISIFLSDPVIRPILMRKLDGFYKFCNDFLELDCNPNQHYIIAKTIKIIGTPLKINLLGLNSALFAGYDGDDKQKLAFGLHQSQQAFQALNEDAHLSIAFFHHPFECFHDCERVIQNQLKEKVDLILTGHLHNPNNINQNDAAGKTVIIQAGASYEKRESDNSFNVGVLDLATGKGKVQFYKYIKDKDRWTKNTDVNLDEDDGSFSFNISSLQKSPILPKFISQKIKKNELFDLSSVNYLHGFSTDSAELEEYKNIFCTLWLPHSRNISYLKSQEYYVIVAICFCDINEVLDKLSIKHHNSIFKIKNNPISESNYTIEEKKEIFQIIGSVFSKSLITAAVLPSSMLDFENNTIFLYDEMLKILLLPIVKMNIKYPLNNFNLRLSKVVDKYQKQKEIQNLEQTARKIIKSYNRNYSFSVEVIDEQGSFQIIEEICQAIAWAVKRAYNSNDERWIKELEGSMNSGDFSNTDKSPPK